MQTQENKASYTKIYNIIFIRGLLLFFVGLYYIVAAMFIRQNKIDGANILKKTENNLNISWKSITALFVCGISLFFSYLVLGILPIKISYYLVPKAFNIVLKRGLCGLIKCIILFGFLSISKIFQSSKQFYAFNSAIRENNAEEKQINFLDYFLCSIFFVTIAMAFIGQAINKWYNVFINVFIFVIMIGIFYEFFNFLCKKNIEQKFFAPILILIRQKCFSKEQKCVNIVTMELNKSNVINTQTDSQSMPFSQAYVEQKQKLEKYGKFEQSDLDFIFCEVLGKNRAEIKLINKISKEQYSQVCKYVEQRVKGAPITKIFGHANFYGLDFIVTKDVLSPRMDTEILVEQIIKVCNKRNKVLDIGTGSGAIAITIAKMCQCETVAVDISEKALNIAKQNAKNNNVSIKFLKSDLFNGIKKHKFNIIVSNPPYIPSAQINQLDNEVKEYDPVLALDGGEDGLDFYKKIIFNAPNHLIDGGMIFFEVGIGQANDVKKLLQKKFKDIRIVKDNNNIQRVVYATIKQ